MDRGDTHLKISRIFAATLEDDIRLYKKAKIGKYVNIFHGWSKWARVTQNQELFFKTHFWSSWVKAMEAFTEVMLGSAEN